MNADRGMMKWMPYQSLVEQGSFLRRMRYEKNKIARPHISSERANDINEILTTYGGEEVKARYFEDGYLFDLIGHIDRIDPVWHYLLIDGKKIQFVNLINLER